MSPPDVFDRLRALLVADFEVDADRVVPSAHLRADLGFDSLTLTDLAFMVQSDFSFKATAEAFRDVRTVGDLAEVIRRHVG